MESKQRPDQAPKIIEFRAGIFATDHERFTVAAMLLENLGIDKVLELGNLDDWKAAIAKRDSTLKTNSSR